MHSNDGFYLKSSMEHYRADKCYDRVTKAVRISDTVAFQDDRITKPRITHADLLVKAIADLSNYLRGMSNVRNEANLEDLRRLTKTTESLTERNKSRATMEALLLRVPAPTPPVPNIPTTAPNSTTQVIPCRSQDNPDTHFFFEGRRNGVSQPLPSGR